MLHPKDQLFKPSESRPNSWQTGSQVRGYWQCVLLMMCARTRWMMM